MKTLIQQIRQELEKSVDEKALISSNHFFKEGEQAKVRGVKVKIVRNIAKYFLNEIKTLPKSQIFDLCEKLWKSGYFEDAVIACDWTNAIRKQYEPDDFKMFERWVANYVDNWASCDSLCNPSIGEFVVMYPEYISNLNEWAKSDNRWMRRAAAVTMIIPARKGLFLDDIFQTATVLLHDKDDLVQKGYGWMLKEASEKHYQKEVFDFVMKNKATMPRTALRYAIEKMPPEMKAEAMKK
jgi:3-methyladenine DNA glycosylase AlkD